MSANSKLLAIFINEGIEDKGNCGSGLPSTA